MKQRCCGNCKHFKYEDASGFGLCEKSKIVSRCNTFCDDYTDRYNGWTEITQDNEDEVYNVPPKMLVIASVINGQLFCKSYDDMPSTISTMAKLGGYYYYELPELRLE